MSTINVKDLPVIDEIFEPDMLLVNANDRTALIKLEDFVIGEQQVSFYQEIVNNRNALSVVSTSIDNNKVDIEKNVADIENLTTLIDNTTTRIDKLEADGLTLAAEMENMKTRMDELEISVDNQAVQTAEALEKINEVLSVNESLASRINEIEEANAELTTRVDELLAAINNANSGLFAITKRVEALE